MSTNGLRSTNTRPGGAYQAPVLPMSSRVGGDFIKPETWDEVLSYLQAVLEENGKLSQVLKENNEQVERVMRKKDDEIENAHKLHWDVRISVLGFKSKIMALTDQLDELRKKEGGGGEGNGGGRSATAQEIAELQVKIRDLQSGKLTAERSAHQLGEEMESLKDKLSQFESAYERSRRENQQKQSTTAELEIQVLELQEQLKKGRSPPMPKPRTNVQTPKSDGKVVQLEREREELRAQTERLQQRVEEEKVNRQQAEEKWMAVRSEMEKRERETQSHQRSHQDLKFQKSQLLAQVDNLITKVERLDKENIELRKRPPGGGGGQVSMAMGGGALKQRRLLNEAMEQRNIMERKYSEAMEDLKEHEHKYTEQKRKCEDTTADNCRLSDSNHTLNQELQQLKEQLDDTAYEQGQEINTLRKKAVQLEVQLQNLNEKHHTLQVEYSKSLSELRTIRQKGDHVKKELKEGYNQTLKEMEDLMQAVEEKDVEIQKLQTEFHALMAEKGNSDSNYERVMQKLQQKQKNCDEYLEQMEMWRVQYETAYSDFQQERTVREKEAKAVQTLRDNRDELQREIGELRKRVTDQRITIANLQTSSGYVPESYTREINIAPQGGSGTSPGTRRTQRYEPPYKETDVPIGGVAPVFPSIPHHQPHPVGGDIYHPVGGHMGYNEGSKIQDPRHQDPVIPPVPDPNLGRLNQLDNPPLNNFNRPSPPMGGVAQRSPANAFPQFPQAKERPPPPNGGGGRGFDLPGEVQKTEAPVVENCPICGRAGFKTQTDLEVHAAKCM